MEPEEEKIISNFLIFELFFFELFVLIEIFFPSNTTVLLNKFFILLDLTSG